VISTGTKPAPPKSAWFYYVQENVSKRSKKDNVPYLTALQTERIIWDKLSETRRAKYTRQQLKDEERYNDQVADFELNDSFIMEDGKSSRSKDAELDFYEGKRRATEVSAERESRQV
jgi:hypothetical protein